MKIPVGKVVVEGNLTVPSGAIGIVLFAHGSGSSRFSPRNQYVAKEFNKAKIGTLLFDLLTREEEEQDMFTAEYRFNIPLLAERLIGATQWLKERQADKRLPLRLFRSKHRRRSRPHSRRKTPSRHRRRGFARRTTRPGSGLPSASEGANSSARRRLRHRSHRAEQASHGANDRRKETHNYPRRNTSFRRTRHT